MRLIALLPLLFALGAHAQPLSDEQWVSTRAWVVAGPHWRTFTERFSTNQVIELTAPTVSGANVQGAYAHYFRRWFGVTVDLRSELSSVWPTGQMTKESRASQNAFKTSVAASFRWQAGRVFGLEGRLGFLGGVTPLIVLDPNGRPTSEGRLLAGPVFAVAATFDVTPRFTAQLVTGLELRFGGLESGNLFFGANARFGFLTVGDLDVGAALSLELNRIGNSDPKALLTNYDETILRVGIGPSLTIRTPAPVVEPVVKVAPSVTGSVTRADGSVVAGAVVSSGGVTTKSDAQGLFVIEGLAPGPSTVLAEAGGLRSAKKDVVVTPGTPVEVKFVLALPTGPGSIAGVVRSKAEKPLAGAKVVAGSMTTTSSALGEWSVTGVGPGPVKVKISFEGFAPADEVVQVPPEAKATLDVALEPLAQRTKAKIRGVISSASGPVAKASVRIVELKLKQAVKADGRFEAEVAGGKYTLVIEAPKHVTQTRTVEVLDGDQAIFQIELEKAR